MKQYKINDDYKVNMRRDIGDFSHGDMDHWNLEVQTISGNQKYYSKRIHESKCS